MALSDTVLSRYLKEINQIPLLTREEEQDLARRAAHGDALARERLANANLRFVVNVAKKYQNQGLPLSDLISEGNIGLLNAIERFDVDKGYHFISYAVWWIRQAILKAICEKSRLIRLPLNRANELVQIEKARKLLSGGKSQDSEILEVARMLDMDVSLVADLIQISQDHISLESPVFSEKDSSTIGDFVEDSAYASPEEGAFTHALREDLDEILAALPAKEEEILRLRYGLSGEAPMSLKEIGERFGLTKERIRQIEKKALERLQQPSKKERLASYVA